MPNRRQRIKYQGLQGYRQRQQMRRMMDGRNPYGSESGYVTSGRRDGLMMDDMRAYQQGNYPRELSEMTMQRQPMMHDPYMPRDYGMDYARREQCMSGGHGGNRADYGSGMPYAGVPAFYAQNGQEYDMRGGGDYGDYAEDMARGGQGSGSRNRAGQSNQGGQRNEYGYGDMAMNGNYGNRRGQVYDGHHMGGGYGMGGYIPIEAMGYFNGYYGMGQDFARGQGGNQGGRRDMGMSGDFGENLSEKELDHWCKKLKEQLDEREKQMFSKEAISKHAKQIGRQMEGFGEKELEVATLMIYTDYKQSIGQNLDLAVRLAFDWLNDKDASVKGAEKLAVYYDCIIEGDDDQWRSLFT